MDEPRLPSVPRDVTNAIANAQRLQRDLSAVTEPIRATIQAHERAMASIRETVMGPFMAAIRAQEQIRTTLLAPVLDAMRAHEKMRQQIMGPLLDTMRAHERIRQQIIGPMMDAMRIHEEARKAMIGPVLEAMRAREEMQKSILGAVSMALALPKLYGIAATMSESTRADLTAGIGAALDELDADDVEPTPVAIEPAVRQALDRELARRVDDFDSLPQSGKVVQLLDVVISNPSFAVSNAAFTVALSQLADMLGEPDPQRVITRAIWLVVFMLFGWVSRLGVKERVPKTRQILRTLPIDQHTCRIVTRTCIISNQPKARAKKIGWLTIGHYVTVTDTVKGWRQIYFTNSEGNDRIGWVRSKYLSKV